MPQLNPAPWFMILAFSWFVLLALMPLKVTKHIEPNQPSQKSAETPKTEPWNWPWQ
uniref:ATP synthase complex subunit 8 n=1 Tax=Glaucosoma buergeri TaxID=443781 RepID=A0A348B088_9TELE|nr:ATPase subunit 8 [Glaucosoma buergeri]